MSDILLERMKARWGNEQLNNSPDYDSGELESQEELPEYKNPRTLDDKLKKEAIREKKIKNEKELNNLILRKMIQAIIEEVGHGIQTSFIDFSRRESPLIAALLGVPEKEMQLSEILSEKIKVSIDSVVSITEKYSKDEFYE